MGEASVEGESWGGDFGRKSHWDTGGPAVGLNTETQEPSHQHNKQHRHLQVCGIQHHGGVVILCSLLR